ncbi:MAG: amino acid adenylation domain-containing protein, partial [Prochloraceae cyanobacterium]|nr:amino acid adenylation domain-containing protein [Prochloraceae cyanobacterium]
MDYRKRLEKLTPEQRELVLQKLRKQEQDSRSQKTTTTIPLVPISREQEIPLSFAQQRLWFLYQFEERASYNISAALQLQGSLNKNALEQALASIIARHEILRTNFKRVNGSVTQVINPVPQKNIVVIDLQKIPKTERSKEAQRIATEEAQRTFDLTTECLLRVTLLQLDREEYLLIVTMHHIISDGWSIGIFVRELSKLYSAFSSGINISLPELSIQYADFAHWQRQWLKDTVLETQLSYWKQKLAGAFPLLKLPTDRPRPPIQTFRGRKYKAELSVELIQQLKNISKESKATLFMSLLTVFTILLSRYSSQEDIVIGSPIANRNRKEIESLIGFFVNTLVLRINLEGNPNFLDLLARSRQLIIEAYANQDVPFEKLVEELHPERSLSYSPLFQVGFSVENTSIEKLEFPDLSIKPVEIEKVTAKYDLTLFVEETESGGAIGAWEYNSDLFDEATIARMAEHFKILLENIVANPRQPVFQLSMLTEAEQHQLLVEWNNTEADRPRDCCIHQLFEEQVELNPDAIAVVLEDTTLTYAQLNAQANQLANYLQTLGVKPEVLVGVYMDRSISALASMLAILKAGGAYLPLDPAYPQERIAFIISDAGVPLLLTQEKLASQLRENQARIVCIDAEEQIISQQSQTNAIADVKSDNLAYTIYTSGSTGKPKGVLVTHLGLCNLARTQIKTFEVNSESHVLQFASLSFDASVWEIVMALCSGARLCLGTRDSLLPGANLMELLRQHQITHITLPPTALAVLPAEEFPDLQTIIVAGEACSLHLAAQWSVGRRFFNAYGPSESTVCATIAEYIEGQELVHIGRPIDNIETYILDPYLKPVPIGVPGELHLGGVGLARGYLNREDLSQEKFISHPFSDEPGARLYKTGDLVRYLGDGHIEFLGRIDNQIKIRGFRIELGEIEQCLNQNPQVREAVVTAREDESGYKRLAAYIVPNQETVEFSEPQDNTSQLSSQNGSESLIPNLRASIRDILPDYMMPSTFTVLDNLPLTPNGKVDRKSLPAPEQLRAEIKSNFVAPRNSTEENLATLWSEVLGVEQVSIHDNFFELGGDSILSIQITSRANQLGLKLAAKDIFQHQTIAQLATVVSKAGPIQAEQGQVTGSLPLTPIQHWFFDQNMPEPHHYNQSILLEVSPEIDLEILQQVLEQILIHHDA